MKVKFNQPDATTAYQPLAAYKLLIYGQVQGVGFRPFVVNLAKKLSLTGWVSNSGGWVEALIVGLDLNCHLFIKGLYPQSWSQPPHSKLGLKYPRQAKVKQVKVLSHPPAQFSSFTIKKGRANYDKLIYIPPDFRVCPECLKEVKDPHSRWFNYVFHSCVNCGPRFTILTALPYDRLNTTMNTFQLCVKCQEEYSDITNVRRYAAETISCPTCGPTLSVSDTLSAGKPSYFGQSHYSCSSATGGKIVKRPSSVLLSLRKAAENLLKEEVVALKGVGGFHLVCLATSRHAIKKIKQFKNRPDKPLAVMFKDLKQAQKWLNINQAAKEKLTSPEAPIVIVKVNRPKQPLAKELFWPHLSLGIFLAYTPLHYLLLDLVNQPLVVTSANKDSEPIIYQNKKAEKGLSQVASCILKNNRRIYFPVDDAVVKETKRHWLLIRNGRGFVPLTLPLASSFKNKRGQQLKNIELLAVGADLKNSFCLVKNGFFYVSQYHGDLENASCLARLQENYQKLASLIKFKPKAVVVDLHPDYVGRTFAQSLNLPLIAVQHHHAHVASCLAENNLHEVVIGVAFDGTGYGLDGAIWGGEWLIANTKEFSRLAHFAPFKMPGGELAVKHPWRLAVSFLTAAGFSLAELKAVLADLSPQNFSFSELEVVYQQLQLNLNSPLSTAASRLFEALSALLGLCSEQTYEGQAATYLEAVAQPIQQHYPYHFEYLPSGEIVVNWQLMFKHIVSEIKERCAPSLISGKFHFTIANIIKDVCQKISQHQNYKHQKHGQDKLSLNKVVLSGGVFQNSLLVDLTEDLLLQAGFQVFINEKVPVNDGGLSLGQAAIGLAQLDRD